jgi:hypothetical protein
MALVKFPNKSWVNTNSVSFLRPHTNGESVIVQYSNGWTEMFYRRDFASIPGGMNTVDCLASIINGHEVDQKTTNRFEEQPINPDWFEEIGCHNCGVRGKRILNSN